MVSRGVVHFLSIVTRTGIEKRLVNNLRIIKGGTWTELNSVAIKNREKTNLITERHGIGSMRGGNIAFGEKAKTQSKKCKEKEITMILVVQGGGGGVTGRPFTRGEKRIKKEKKDRRGGMKIIRGEGRGDRKQRCEDNHRVIKKHERRALRTEKQPST